MTPHYEWEPRDMTYRTTIWMRADDNSLGNVRCIWRGILPHVLRAGDDIVIDPDRSIERVETASYCLKDGTVEARLGGIDAQYPEVEYKWPEE